MQKALKMVEVSIIIPVYNAASYIKETIDSVLAQTISSWELIVINDGSTDDSESIIASYRDSRISLFNQNNQGVSITRNNGLRLAKGIWLVFLDADDVLGVDFLKQRISFLKDNPTVSYVGGDIISFPIKAKRYQAALGNNPEEILFFKKGFSTVPSNYLFRTDFLITNQIYFNKNLSSTADKYFLLQLSKAGKGARVTNSPEGFLHYRISPNSMSSTVDYKLISDNEKFFFEVVKEKLVSDRLFKRFKCFFSFSLASSFAKIRYWKKSFFYFAKSFTTNPFHFSKYFISRMFK